MATQAEVAAHLFLSDRSVRDLISRGVLPAARRGELDLDDCRRRYIDHLRMTAAGRARGLEGGDSEHVGLDLEAERAGLARAQKEAYELKNAATRLELLPKAAISRAVAAAPNGCAGARGRATAPEMLTPSRP